MIIKKNKHNFQTLTDVCLYNLGVKSTDEINKWAIKHYNNQYHIHNLDKVVSYVLESFKNKKVLIVGDYDVDGITATSILMLSLKAYGFTHISYRIPKRMTEGYGISEVIINEAIEHSIDLIITVDNGIAAIEPIKKAKEHGMSVVVLDHHMPAVIDGKNVFPDADFIVDPEADTAVGNAELNDFDGYCGAGLAYRFAREFITDKILLNQYLTLATLGTICDSMPLRQENYIMVRNGLKKMLYSTYCTSGLYALLSAFGLNDKVQEDDIGFKIGPALNAPSRLLDEGSTKSIELLTFTGDIFEAQNRATALQQYNKERQALSETGVNSAEDIIFAENHTDHAPIIVYLPNTGEGIIGIIAGQITSKYKMPCIIFSDCDEDTSLLKGSGRAPDGYDLKSHLDTCVDHIYKYGGHPGAAGVTIKREELDNFKKAMLDCSRDFVPADDAELVYDIEIQSKDVENSEKIIDAFAPFGQMNKKPIVKVLDFKVEYNRYKDAYYDVILGKHMKYTNKSITALGFNLVNSSPIVVKPEILELVGTLSRNYYKGKITNQIIYENATIA